MAAPADPVSQARTSRISIRISASALAGLSLDALLFWAALALFAATRLIGLERFPIYFFTDEAVQTVQAADFVDRGFRDASGRLFPTYFQNSYYWNLSTSVYLQVIPHELFGFSVFATRATSALVALSGTAAVALILRDVFRVRAWWLGALFLAITPAWFLHSRTAFETVIGASFFAWFLYFYLRYRTGAAWHLYPALLFGALAFYSYSSIQLTVVLTGAALAISDLRYHLQNRRAALFGGLLLALLVLPYLRFRIEQGDEVVSHLRTLGSYWVEPDLGFGDKVWRFLREYSTGLSPMYWFNPGQDHDLARHLMKGYGNILPFTAPFFFLGLAQCMRRFRSPEHRALLIALVLAPAGAALVAVQVTRALAFVVPAAALSGIGAAMVIDYLSKRVSYGAMAGAAFAVMSLAGVFMLQDALRRGPTWYTDYGLYGMQYSATQVRDAIRAELRDDPGAYVYLTPNWANGPETVVRFVLPHEARVEVRSISFYQGEHETIPANAVFVMTPGELQSAAADLKFSGLRVGRTVPYPTGETGFSFVRLGYSDAAADIFAVEAEQRLQTVAGEIDLGGQRVGVRHSQFDDGTLANIFDGDLQTLARTSGANPAIVQLAFSEPRRISSVFVATGHPTFVLLIEATGTDGIVRRYRADAQTAPSVMAPSVTADLNPEDPPVRLLRLSVRDPNEEENKAHVHIREVRIQ